MATNETETVAEPVLREVVDELGHTRVYAPMCLLILPSADTSAWLRQITRTAQAEGFDIHEVRPGEPLHFARPSRTILITHDTATLSDIAAELFAVICTGQATTAQTMSPANDAHGDYRAGAFAATRFLAIINSLPRDRTTIFSDEDVRAGATVFAAFPGVRIAPPDGLNPDPPQSTSLYLRQFVKGIQIYKSGFVDVGAEADWDSSLYVFDNRPDLALPTERISILGVPRLLVSGPHLHLPAGVWAVTAEFTVDAKAAQHSYRAEWGDLDGYDLYEFVPQKAGRYRLELQYAWTSPTYAELRISLGESALDGLFSLTSTHIRRTG
jgi:hypothetical protein